jgi:phage shock protein E
MHRRYLLTAAAVLLAGCDVETDLAPGDEVGSEVDAQAVDLVVAAEERVLIDVRTDEEFHAGHLEGALHVDVQRPDFEARVAELDPDEAYLVYCRTGNRSAQAIERMRALGFTDLVDGRSFEDLAAAGVAAS